MSNHSYSMVMGAIVRSRENEEFSQLCKRSFFRNNGSDTWGMDGERLVE